MRKPIFSIVMVAFFAMSFASNLEDMDMLTGVDQDYMIGLCNLLTHQGYITEITNEQCYEKNIVELIDLAINANELAKQRNPQAASDRDVNIAFLKNARRKWINVNPHLETGSTHTHHGITTFVATSNFGDHTQGLYLPPFNQPESNGQFNEFPAHLGNQEQKETHKSDPLSDDKSSEEENKLEHPPSSVHHGKSQQRPHNEFAHEHNSASSTHASSASHGFNEHLPQNVPQVLPQVIPGGAFQDHHQGAFQDHHQGNVEHMPSELTGESTHEHNSASSSHASSSFHGFNEHLPQNVPQVVPEGAFPDHHQGNAELNEEFTQEHSSASSAHPSSSLHGFNEHLPQNVPNGVPQFVPDHHQGIAEHRPSELTGDSTHEHDSSAHTSSSSHGFNEHLPQNVLQVLPQVVPEGAFEDHHQGNAEQRPSELTGELEHEHNSASSAHTSAHTSSSSHGFNEHLPQNVPQAVLQVVPENAHQEHPQSNGPLSGAILFPDDVNDRHPEEVPQVISQGPPQVVPQPQHVPNNESPQISNPTSQAWTSANDGIQNVHHETAENSKSDSVEEGRPALEQNPVINPAMNPANFLPTPNERPAVRPPQPQQHRPQQQYPPQQQQQYPPQNNYPQQHYPTQPTRKPSRFGLLSTFAKFVSKIF